MFRHYRNLAYSPILEVLLLLQIPSSPFELKYPTADLNHQAILFGAFPKFATINRPGEVRNCLVRLNKNGYGLVIVWLFHQKVKWCLKLHSLCNFDPCLGPFSY